ncbi:MAG: pyridoxamine 5'-phosphate oxidase family protein [Candidatus Promineifilaceae bacterium]
MKRKLTALELTRLETERNIWLATIRSNGRPHLVPIWFIWHEACLFLGMKGKSVKARNLQQNPNVSLALEDGSNVVICEGSAETYPQPWSAELLAKFKAKYDWDIPGDPDGYGLIVKIKPRKWMMWGAEDEDEG